MSEKTIDWGNFCPNCGADKSEQEMKMKYPDFWLTYNYINKVVQEAHPGQPVDQASLMDAVVRIYLDEKERYCREMEKGRE